MSAVTVESDDVLLVHDARQGDRDAYDKLVERHSAMAYRVSFRMLGNHYDAQDLVQESMLAAWRNLDSFRGNSSFSTWLYRIVTRKALNRLTRDKVHHSLDLFDDMPAGPAGARFDPQMSLERRATVDAVASAVAELPLPQRTAVVLHHFEGLSYEDVAAVTCSSTASVRSHLFRARRRLAGVLREPAA